MAELLPDWRARARHGVVETEISASDQSLAGAMSVTQLFDAIAIRVDGPRAWNEALTIAWEVTDDVRDRMELSNGALIHFLTERAFDADVTVTLTRIQLMTLATADPSGIDVQGDPGVLQKLLSLLEAPDSSFNVVTP